eukprot:TRINITY_DN1042_c0_g1_i4.p1 TRINITY_DN1042_c0_g1~~TRINITY_DN1042_c0_g1_i4.p1  ORF type:complete len:133 (+),score=27.21 TRINITY_DN1042_c0_g1_i4:2-400(+)
MYKYTLAIVAIAAIAFCVTADEATAVAELTDATFEEYVKGKGRALIMFYAPWCGHCKRLKPTFSEAGTALKAAGNSGILAKVDCTVEKDLCGKYGVRGYPTLKAFRGDTDPDKAEKYTMGRTKEDLMSFMTK